MDGKHVIWQPYYWTKWEKFPMVNNIGPVVALNIIIPDSNVSNKKYISEAITLQY